MPKKQRNKGPKRASKPAVRLNEPVFHYTSACCGVRASKPALVKTPEAEGTLGTWRCSGCSKICKVARTRIKSAEEKIQESCDKADDLVPRLGD